jgi:hypothetical protein
MPTFAQEQIIFLQFAVFLFDDRRRMARPALLGFDPLRGAQVDLAGHINKLL